MNQYNDLKKGQLVRSIRGRDKGTIQVVIDLLDDSHVLVVDGKRRKLDTPKKKKIKHLQRYNTIIDLTDVDNDCKIRKILKDFK
ncbi:MAG: KOW domain-containing protein [Tissierellia bacterium]|nr:KOW domain-containing protein [Tissierellia bacterium]